MSMRSDAPEAQQRFYGSRTWKKCREEYRKSVGGLCERCLSRGIVEPGYIVHHKRYVTAKNVADPDVLLNWDNLELLCQNCHNTEHGRKKKRFSIGPGGEVFC